MSQETKREPLVLQSGQYSLQGCRMTMEDESVIHENFPVKGQAGNFSLYGVFDGHGGTMAARYVKSNLPALLIKYLEECSSVAEAFSRCYQQLDKDFLALPTRDNSGTTVVCALVHTTTKRLWVANAGDSRCVLCRRDEAVALSKDHKPERPDEQERIRKAGGFVIHNRVMGGLAVSRAIGDCDFKQDGLVLVTAEPEVEEQKIGAEDGFLVLACDGLFDVMQNDAVVRFIKRALTNGKSPTQAATAIGSHAIKNLHSQDNVSVMVVRFDHATDPPGAAASSLEAPSATSPGSSPTVSPTTSPSLAPANPTEAVPPKLHAIL